MPANPALNEPFASLPPKDNFYQSASFFPMSFALITTVNEDGVTSIGPHSLTFPFDLIEEPSMMLVSRASSNTSLNLERTGKAALNYVEFDEEWLKAIVGLGYPGQTPVDKMKDIPFNMVKSPTPGYAANPEYPLIIEEAFQVYECELNGSFQYHPHRETAEPLAEHFFALRVKNILLKETMKQKLDGKEEFPKMPISFGFRGGDLFWFAEHNKPFGIQVPRDKGPQHQQVLYMANRIDPDVRFTEDACKQLTGVPSTFLETVLQGIVDYAKAEGVSMVDEGFLKKAQEQAGQ